MKALSRIYSKSLFFAWVLVIGAICLILRSGLYSDDLPDYQRWQSMGHITFIQMLHILYEEISQTLQAGRFLPVSYFLQDFLFWLSDTILIYKILLFGFNLMAVYSFTRMMYVLGLRVHTPLSLLVFCSLAQFYSDYHDSFGAFHAMFPLLATLIFASVSSFIMYLREGRLIMLCWSFILTLLALYDSEIGFVIFPVMLIILAVDSRRFADKLLVVSPFIGLVLSYVCLFIFIRAHSQGLYHGIETGFEMARMVQVLFFQIFATIPLTAFIKMGAIPHIIATGLTSMWPILMVMGVSFYWLLQTDMQRSGQGATDAKQVGSIVIGMILWVFPALILMASKKYQTELNFGRGYLPAYVQNFGLVIIVSVLLSKLFEKYQSAKVKKGVYVLLYIIFILTYLRNDFINNTINTRRSIPACFYYKSLKNGILKDCEQGAIIVLKTDYFFHCPLFYQQIVNNFYHSGLKIVSEEEFSDLDKEKKGAFYILEHDNSHQCTLLYKVLSQQNTLIKQINYPTGNDFSYFDLISRPL